MYNIYYIVYNYIFIGILREVNLFLQFIPSIITCFIIFFKKEIYVSFICYVRLLVHVVTEYSVKISKSVSTSPLSAIEERFSKGFHHTYYIIFINCTAFNLAVKAN